MKKNETCSTGPKFYFYREQELWVKNYWDSLEYKIKSKKMFGAMWYESMELLNLLLAKNKESTLYNYPSKTYLK